MIRKPSYLLLQQDTLLQFVYLVNEQTQDSNDRQHNALPLQPQETITLLILLAVNQ